MRIIKQENGAFTIDDAPMAIGGEDAVAFVAKMAKRDAAPVDEAKRKFLEQCEAEYLKTQR